MRRLGNFACYPLRMKSFLQSFSCGAFVACMCASALAQDAKPTAAQGAPTAMQVEITQDGKAGQMNDKEPKKVMAFRNTSGAGKANPADTIDPKAKVIYDASVAAAKKVTSFDGVTQMKMEIPKGEELPPGFGEPARFVMMFCKCGHLAHQNLFDAVMGVHA